MSLGSPVYGLSALAMFSGGEAVVLKVLRPPIPYLVWLSY